MASEPKDNKGIMGGDPDVERNSEDNSSFGKGDILQLEHTDPVLNAKMHLVNNVSRLRTFQLNGQDPHFGNILISIGH